MMKVMRLTVFLLLILGLTFSVAFAIKHLPEERGKTLFNDPKFAGGTAGKSCNSCHPDGKGLEKSAAKKEFSIMGKKQKSLEEAINFCIVNANKGNALDSKSEQMKDMVAYIKSLKEKAPAEKTKKAK